MHSFIRTKGTRLPNLVNILVGLLIGIVAGIGTMILFAPQSGKKTRNQIRVKSVELQDRAAVTYADLLTLSQFDNREILIGTGAKKW